MKLRKAFLTASLSMCILAAGSLTALASDTAQPEITIQTDKDVYSANETITEVVKVKNNTDTDLAEVDVEGSIPDGYEVSDKTNSSGQWRENIPKLAAGAESEIKVQMTKKADKPAATQNNDSKKTTAAQKKDSLRTGDQTNMLIWLLLFAASAGCLIFAFVKKKTRVLSLILVAALTGGSLTAMGNTAKAADEQTGSAGEEISASHKIKIENQEITLTAKITNYKEETAQTEPTEPEVTTDLSYDGYTEQWRDDFEGEALNRDDWNVELHDPGWVNQEWQAYIDSPENIYVQDGELVLKAIKEEDANGGTSYTSGRVNTQNKHDYKYGIFEAKLRVPSGKGFLPAFWMMPTNENLYGQWPKCGEIDIMEVLGDQTDTVHGTLHFGEPHTQAQGTHKLESGDFASEYHLFSCEWEPGKIRFYMDGKLYYTATRWFSKKDGFGEVTYPAPYDQPFYMILNLAVGGSWVGYPDADAVFAENAEMHVDYVRVLQKDAYDENVTKPDPEKVELRDPDSTGNYVINGDFAETEDLSDDQAWKFMLAGEGQAEAKIADKQIDIISENAGNLDYSIQLVQAQLPMEQGKKYKLSFDAWADEARTMITNVTAPDHNYGRYLNDTKVALSTEQNHFEYSFDMTSESDANGRIEFNLGNQGSTAAVHITNVRLEQVGDAELPDQSKTVLPDGNYVYNGSFEEGTDRMAYWETANKDCVSVTNDNNIRRLMINAPEGTSESNPVIVTQSELGLVSGTPFELSFKAEGNAGQNMSVMVAGQAMEPAILAGEEQSYSYKFSLADGDSNKDLVFKVTEPGIYYVDQVRIVEDKLIKNGSFSAGFTGFSAFKDSSADASWVVDSLNEDNAADFTINDTGDQAWKIQLKQENIELDEGQWYRLTLRAKSNIDRALMFAIQRDGSSDDNWDPYSGEKIVQLSSDYQNYELVFKMKKPTDLHSILSISMGAVNGTRIQQNHRICIDDINLEKIEEPATPETPEQPIGENLLLNPDFSQGSANWEQAITPPAEAAVSIADNKVVFDVTNTGTADWNVQLKQGGLTLEKGSQYRLTFKASSTEARTIKVAMLSPTYDWYGGADIALEKGEEKEISIDLTMNKETDANTTMVVSMGIIEGIETPVSTITLSDFSLTKVNP